MREIKHIFQILVLGILLCLIAWPLSAQKHKAGKQTSEKKQVAVTVNADSLQQVVDSLQNALREIEARYDSQQQELQRLQNGADSLNATGNCDMSYLLNYGNALLFRKYNARVEDIANLLLSVPDSVKQKDWEQMLDQARRMVESSHASQDLRKRVKHLLEQVPQYEQYSEDVREVLRNVPAEAQQEYNLTQQAIDMIDALPKSVTDNENRYAIVRELLVAYKQANEEIKGVLQSIQENPDNSINISDKWPAFVKQIKSTQYYKQYYGQAWTIPYLNGIIDQALARLKNAQKYVDLKDLINML